jgi:hypothetical protein
MGKNDGQVFPAGGIKKKGEEVKGNRFRKVKGPADRVGGHVGGSQSGVDGVEDPIKKGAD